ncbi:MAG: XcyI family restriction endonuclease [Candidatus Limnocylindrales bacterium]|jgi:hypothetical protein
MIETPDATRQLRFHQLLLGARKTWLSDALSETLGAVDPNAVKADVARLVPKDAQAILAGAGIRDEQVFPTPTVVRHKATLLAYYRLLLGLPRKSFYATGTGRGMFASMEDTDRITAQQEAKLDDLLTAMVAALADLVRQISPTVTPRDVAELPLLTLGSQMQGANNNIIGQQGTRNVFLAIRSIVEPCIVEETNVELTIVNASKRRVLITLAADPDVRIREDVGGTLSYKVAIEIKAGSDRSNAHNRAGEAEKSHQKADEEGARDFWTLIAKKGLDMSKLRTESPRTRSWFDVAQILARDGEDWVLFRQRLVEAVGIPEGEEAQRLSIRGPAERPRG